MQTAEKVNHPHWHVYIPNYRELYKRLYTDATSLLSQLADVVALNHTQPVAHCDRNIHRDAYLKLQNDVATLRQNVNNVLMQSEMDYVKLCQVREIPEYMTVIKQAK